jgi:hypothetical protein
MLLRSLLSFVLVSTALFAQNTYPLSQVVAVVPAPDAHLTVLLSNGLTHSASDSLVWVNFQTQELRVGYVSGDGGWVNLPGSTGGSKRESAIAPVVYTSEWTSGNPRTTHRVTTNCETYQDLRICAQMHQRAVAAMQAIYPPS